MSPSSPYQTILTLAQLAWPAFYALMILAAILFVRADGRHPAFCFLAGSILQFLTAMWSLVLFGPLSRWFSDLDRSDVSSMEKSFAIQSCAGFVAHGLTVYGLVMIALIQLRKSRLPTFDEGTPGQI